MPRLSENRVPSYRLHKQSGQAIVTLCGRDICLGRFNSADSRTKYNSLIAEWLAGGRNLPAPPEVLTTVELADAFLQHAHTYYRLADGKLSSEISNFRQVLRPLIELYGPMPAAEFSPLRLKAVRQKLMDRNNCRKTINAQTGRLKHVFKWAVENELVPPSTYHGLMAVAGLRAGRCQVRESLPVLPAPEALVECFLERAPKHLSSMVRLQLLTGMRPGELCVMCGADLDVTGRLWIYRPQQHKTAHHGHTRTVYLGPQAQQTLQPYLRPAANEPLFSPHEAETLRLQALHASRKTSMCWGNTPGSNRKRKPKRRPGDRYTTQSYARAITHACDQMFSLPPELARAEGETSKQWKDGMTPEKRAAVVKWRKEHRFHPHQLRHSAATRLRKEFGLEAAQVILGHKTLTVTQIYAERNVEAAVKVMAQVG